MPSVAEAELKGRFEFVSGIRFELTYSLEVLLSSSARSHETWRRETLSRLPPSLREELAWFGNSPLFWILVGDALGSDWPGEEIDTLLDGIRRLDLETLQMTLLEGALHDARVARKVIAGDLELSRAHSELPPGKREWLEHIGLYPPSPDQPTFLALSRCVDHPEEAMLRIQRVLGSYYEHAFVHTWRPLQHELKMSLEEKQRLFESTSLEEFFHRSLIRVEADSEASMLRALRGGYAVSYGDLRKIYVMPSVFNHNRYWTAFQDPGGVVAFLPYFDHEIPLASGGPVAATGEIDPALIFKALGDPTRFAIASLIARNAMSSAQLAERLELSRPTISHHVLLLREAELLDEESRGPSVILSLRRETVERLSSVTMKRLFG